MRPMRLGDWLVHVVLLAINAAIVLGAFVVVPQFREKPSLVGMFCWWGTVLFVWNTAMLVHFARAVWSAQEAR